MPRRTQLLTMLMCILAVITSACSEKEFDPNDPQKSFGIAKEPYDDENFEIAVQRLGEFKARFPYSKFATEAELLIANAQFELGHYTEAALDYEQFVKLHPHHPQVDFAYFRIGESYWEDAPSEIDREQEFTQKAISEWEELIARMPDSNYAKKARDLVAKGKRRIAESILFVARFYCKQEIYHACAFVSVQLADEFGEYGDLRVEALTLAIKALDQVALAKTKAPDSDKNLYFKSMTAAEIRARSDNFKRLLADYKTSLGKSK
ncbi:MAG: outer membrane protein assembly factor BamD [Deltaproteobacteria bacterium]|nr:outer membrane protein assembly factor BamD [Deltaproteobacteria bacterium]